MKKRILSIFTISLLVFSCQKEENTVNQEINSENISDISKDIAIDLEETSRYNSFTSKDSSDLPCGKDKYKIVKFQLSDKAQQEIANGEVYRIAWFNERGAIQSKVFRNYSNSYSETAFMAAYRKDDTSYRYHWRIKKDSDNIWIKYYPQWNNCTGNISGQVDIKDNNTTEAYYFGIAKRAGARPCGYGVSRAVNFQLSNTIKDNKTYILEWYAKSGMLEKHSFTRNLDSHFTADFASYRQSNDSNRFYWKFYLEGQEDKAKPNYTKWPSCTGKTFTKRLNN